MDQQRRRGKQRRSLRPVDFPVERIQLARVVERAEHKGGEAKHIEVDCACGVPAAHENEQSNEQIKQAHNTEIVFNRQGFRSGSSDQAGTETLVLPPDLVARLRPYTQ